MALLQQPFQTVAKLPETDLLLAARYGRDSVEDKAENKRQLQIAMGLKAVRPAPVNRAAPPAPDPALSGWSGG
jgi:glycogen synthase